MQTKLRRGLLLLFFCFSVFGQEPAEPAPTNQNAAFEAVTTVGQERSGERNIRFQFEGIPYGDVIERFAQMANKPLLAETNVQGTVTFNDPRPYNYQEAFETLNTILSMKNVMLVETDRYLRLVPFQNLSNMPLRIFRGLDQTGDVSGGEVVTVVMDLKNLDATETAKAISNMLSNAGSVAPTSRGKGLIITDRLANIRRVQQLLAEIDTSSAAERQMRAYTLIHASGAVVSDLINKTFGAATAPKRTVFNDAKKSYEVLPPEPTDYVTAVFDEASRTLLLFGPGDRVQMAEDLIKRFEDGDGARGGEVKIFYPQGTKAEDLAKMIRQAIPGVAGENESGSAAATKARVIVDREMNRLIVAAPIAGQLDAIENLVNRIESSARGGGSSLTGTPAENVQITKVMRLQVADPTAAFRVVTNAFTRRAPNGEFIPTVKANLDAGTKTIVITGSPGDVQHALGIIEQMENISPGAGPIETAFLDFPSTAELKRVQPLLEQLYANQVLDDPGGAHAKFVPDPEGRRLIVSASPKHLEIVRKTAEQLRAPAITAQPREFRAIRLQNLRMDEALKTINDLVNERMNDDMFRDVPKPLLLPDAPNNRLLITANAAQLKEIEAIVKTVDFAPQKPEREIASIPLQSLNASEILPSLTQLMRPIAEAHPDAGNRPEVIADATGKSLIVSAVPEDVEKIRGIVRQLEGGRTDGGTREFKTVKLYGRSPSEIVPIAEQLYREQLKGQPEPAGGMASFVAEPGANRVIVVGPESEVARAEQIIRQLDPALTAAGREETRVIRLKNAVAQEIAGLVEKSLNLDEQKVKLLVDERSNSLVVSGSSAGVASAAQIIEQLDASPASEPREIRVFDLQGAEPRTAASLLTDLLADTMKNLRGANYTVNSRVVADDDNNRVVVTGTPEELREAAAIMKQLDQPTQQTEGTRVFKLSSGSAREMARTLEDAMITYTRGGGRRQRVSVSADEATNSLVVSGSRADLEEAALIIEKLDGGNGAGRQVRILELRTDAPAELVRLAQQVWSAQSNGRRNDVTITSDPTGRRAIIVAPESVIAQVEQVVTGLDQEPGGAPRSLQVVELTRRSASELMPNLTRLYEEQSKGSKERVATIVPEASGSRLLVYGSEEQAKAIRELVAQLESGVQNGGRETRMFEVGQSEDVTRILPLVQQLYREQMKDSPASDPADAQILGDERAGRLIVTARTEHLERIEQIIAKLVSGNPAPKQFETRTYNLSTATAAELAQTLTSLYQERIKNDSSLGSSRALILPDSVANRLIVSGSANHLELIEELVKTLDQVTPQTGGTRVFKLKAARAEDVASLLSTALVQYNRNFGRVIPRVSVGADVNSNSLVVSGEPVDLNAAAAIIEQLDSGTELKERQLRIVPVSTGQAADLATKVRQLYMDQIRNQPGLGAADALIMPDSGADRLILAANEAQLGMLQSLISTLDGEPAEESRQFAIQALRNNSAQAVAGIISQFFARNVAAQDGSQRLVVTAAPDDRTLILEGTENLLEKVNEFTAAIENVEHRSGMQVRSYQVGDSKATELAPSLERLFTEREGGSSSRNQRRSREESTGTQPRFEADPAANILLVAATESQFEIIDKLIEELKATAQVASEIRTFMLTNSDADEIVPVLASMLRTDDPATQNLMRRYQPWRVSNDPKTVNVASAPGMNAVIVQGPPTALTTAEQIIRSLDNPENAPKSVIQTVRLKKAAAENVAQAVNDALEARGQRNNARRATVTPVFNSNSLLVDGPAEAVSDVIKIIQDLDEESTGGEIEIRVYKLEHGKARELSRLLEQTLRGVTTESFRRGGRQSAGRRETPVTVSADEQTNSLIISGSPDQFRMIEQLLVTLDQNAAQSDRTVRFVLLQNARAVTVADQLTLLFEDRRADERPVIEPDMFANSLTIIGSRSDIAEIERVIAEIDQVSREESIQVRMMVIDAMPAEQLAKMLQGLYAQMSQSRIEIVDKIEPPPPADTNQPPAQPKTSDGKTLVTISIDKTANALLMSGPTHELDAIYKLIDDLTWSALGAESEFRQFALEEADPVAVARVLNELFKPEPIRVQREGQQQPQVVTPAARMTIVAEPRTRSLIVRGRATDFVLLEQLLEKLDQKGVTAQLTPRLVPLTHADPQKILPLVTQMVQQLENARPGDPVSIAADPRTRSIFLIARDTLAGEIETFIKSLDTPSAFAEAEVAMVALKNTVASQLASILQNMLRPGATGELTPEARELQEQVRSLRIRNEQGQEVVLDLSKPIKIMADSTPGARGGNRLILSSTPDNLKALTAVAEMMDTVALVEGVTFKILRLQNADSESVAQTLNTIFQQGKTLATGPAGIAQPDSETGRALTSPLNIAADRRSNSLVLSGHADAIALAQRLVRDLDEEFKGFVTEVRLFRLNYASAMRLAPLLQTVFAEASPVPGTEGLSAQVTRLQTMVDTNNVDNARTTFIPKTRAALTIQADDFSNTLIVAARADVMPLIEDVIRSMDVPAASGMEMARIYPLQNADASRLLRVINDIYSARGQQMRPEERPALSIDTRTNALIVSGNERIFAFIETLIAQLDKDLPFEYGEFRVIKLENADAAVVANTLQQIIDTRAQQQAALSAVPPQTLRAIVIGDPRINSLIVGGSNDVFELVEVLARQLDVAGIALSGQVRLIPLEHANAGTLATSLNMLFTQRYQSAPSADVQRKRPIIIPDPRINALLVSASVEDNKALDELLQKLDQRVQDPALSISVIGLQHNDSGQVASMIQQVFNGRLQAMTQPGVTPNPQDQVVISSDPLSNALIVVANKENLEMIRGLVSTVDQEPVIEGGLLQIITLERADASRVASMLRNLVSQGLYRPGLTSARGSAARAREALAIAVDARSNTLIISASPENLAIIKEVIRQIDSTDYSLEGDIRLFTLKHARASQLAQTLLQFFQQKRAGEMQGREADRSLPVTILADDRTNTLLVTGGREAFEAIERMLAQLDTEDVYDKMNFRVFALKNSTATKLQSTLTRLFQNRPPRAAGRPSEPITIVADSWANALIVGASVEDMSMVANLIQTLDNTQTDNGMLVQVIPVQRGDARSIAQTVQSLYRETPGTPPSVRVDVDERINALIVSAGEADLKRIVDLVEKLDTSSVARVSEIRIFPLQYAQAEELALVLRTSLTGQADPTGITQSPQQQSMLQFISRTPEGEELVASALKESLLITADSRRNALVISAPVDSMTLIARLIQSLDSQAPQLAKIKVFPLKNADARDMAEVLTSLFRLRQQPGVPSNQRAIQYTLVRDLQSAGPFSEGEPVTATIGSAEQYALTVTIDLRTNSLLLGGTDHYVGLASHIIEQLDSTPAQERRTEVYRLKNSQATNVVTALRSFIDQERQRLVQVAGQAESGADSISSVVGNLQQQFEREVAIEAEPISNTLLLSASPIYFDRFKELIEQLDQPQSQVLIQVILAEVTLDKSRELGVEWTVHANRGNTQITTGTDFGVAQELATMGGFSSAITGSDVSFLLRALDSDGRLEVLSRPQILTADNQQATIDIGQRVPVVTDTRVTEQGGIFNSYQYENVGVSLTVTPRISPNGSVQMEVEPEISQLTSTFVTVSPGVNVPIITQRRATTTVSVQNGQSVIIGGLISTTDDTRRKKVPFLGDIPYLGVLFRSSKALSDRKELLIILTPQLLLTPEEGRVFTQGQLQRSTIKDEIKRDKLQQEILEPILPLFDKPQPVDTNAPPPLVF